MTPSAWIAVVSVLLNLLQTSFFYFKGQRTRQDEAVQNRERDAQAKRCADHAGRETGIQDRLSKLESRMSEQEGYTKRVSEELGHYNSTLSSVQAQLTQMSKEMVTKEDFHQIINLIKK